MGTIGVLGWLLQYIWTLKEHWKCYASIVGCYRSVGEAMLAQELIKRTGETVLVHYSTFGALGSFFPVLLSTIGTLGRLCQYSRVL